MNHDLTYLMIIWWLFDDYSMIIWWLLWLFQLFDEIMCNMNDSPDFAIARLCCVKIPVTKVCSDSARPAKVFSNLLDLSLQSVPVHFDVGGDNRMKARMQTHHCSFCIWNSRIAWSACFALDSLDNALATTHWQPQSVQHVSSRLWASWFDDYLMIIWWLFDDFLSYLINICKNMQSEWLTLESSKLHSPGYAALKYSLAGGQASTFSEGNLWPCFAWFIWISSLPCGPRAFRCLRHNSSLRIIRTRGCKLASFCFWRRIGNLSRCNVSVWASWFPLATVNAVGNALVS